MGAKYHSEIVSKNVRILFGNSDAKPAINGMRKMTRSLVNALQLYLTVSALPKGEKRISILRRLASGLRLRVANSPVGNCSWAAE